jgi:hypothetical protein
MRRLARKALEPSEAGDAIAKQRMWWAEWSTCFQDQELLMSFGKSGIGGIH